ncbi:MAG: hypothetical protein ACYC63_07425 [Armatimonadota bacterium]
MPDSSDLQAAWKQVDVEVKKGSINRSLWDAIAAAQPLAIDGDKFIVGLSPANMRMGGYMTTPQNRRQIESVLQKETGQQLELTVIEGDTAAAWERYKERMQSQVDHTLDQAQFRSEHKGALGVWDTLAADMHRMFSETQLRRFPEQVARLLIRLLPVVGEAEDKAREAEPEAEQVHFTHLNRAFDKISTYTDIPAPIVALEYIRYRSSRKRREG